MVITLSNSVGVQILISRFKLTSSFGLLPVIVKSQLKQSAMNNNKDQPYEKEWYCETCSTCNDSSLNNFKIFILDSLSAGMENTSLMRRQEGNKI